MNALIRSVALVLLFAPLPTLANCTSESLLLKLDSNFDVYIAEQNEDGLTKLVHPDFVWTHNHAVLTDRTREGLLTRLKNRWERDPDSRPSVIYRDVEALIHSDTGVVFGFTEINGDNLDLTMHFMRTYVSEDGECLLLANHTMLIPDE